MNATKNLFRLIAKSFLKSTLGLLVLGVTLTADATSWAQPPMPTNPSEVTAVPDAPIPYIPPAPTVTGTMTTRTATTAAKPFDKRRFSTERMTLIQAGLRSSFPRLGDEFEVMAPASERYNAFSHTLGVYDFWINPDPSPVFAPFAWADAEYGSVGYERLPSMDLRSARGLQKVVLFATMDEHRQISAITAAAIQEADGTWSCKIGKLPLIRIKSPYDLSGQSYGYPVAVYARPVQ
jgi:hypothetical protein